MTGGSICSVAICKSNSKKAKEAGEHLMFFTFPKNPRICKEWIRRCYRKDKFNPNFKRICSKHFIVDDYEDAMQARLLGTHPRKLKKNAVPSLFLMPRNQSKEETELSIGIKRVERKQRKILIENIIKPSTTQLEVFNEPLQEVPSICLEPSSETLDEAIHQLRFLQQENRILKKKIFLHEQAEKILKDKIKFLEKQLKC